MIQNYFFSKCLFWIDAEYINMAILDIDYYLVIL
jgi:hypothetical protein